MSNLKTLRFVEDATTKRYDDPLHCRTVVLGNAEHERHVWMYRHLWINLDSAPRLREIRLSLADTSIREERRAAVLSTRALINDMMFMRRSNLSAANMGHRVTWVFEEPQRQRLVTWPPEQCPANTYLVPLEQREALDNKFSQPLP